MLAFVAVRFVKNADTAEKMLVKKLVEVAFVAKRFVEVLLVEELLVLYIDVAVSAVAEAVVSVVCPVTESVPVA